MPTIAELLAKLAKLEGGADLVEDLGKRINELKSTSDSKVKALEKQVKTIVAVTKAEGEDQQEQLTDAAKKIGNLVTQNQELEQKAAKAEADLIGFKQETKLNQAAKEGNFAVNVVMSLIGDEDKITFADDGKALINNQSVKDWAEKSKPEFISSIFPKQETEDLGSAGSNTSQDTKDLGDGGTKDPSPKNETKSSYISNRYSAEKVKALIN